jgi:hypothetical protein
MRLAPVSIVLHNMQSQPTCTILSPEQFTPVVLLWLLKKEIVYTDNNLSSFQHCLPCSDIFSKFPKYFHITPLKYFIENPVNTSLHKRLFSDRICVYRTKDKKDLPIIRIELQTSVMVGKCPMNYVIADVITTLTLP